MNTLKRIIFLKITGTAVFMAIFLLSMTLLVPRSPNSPFAAMSSSLDAYIYPNPVRGRQPLTLHVEPGDADRLQAQIFDLTGTMILQARVDEGTLEVVNGRLSYEHQWDARIFHPGVYTGVVTGFSDGKPMEQKKFRFSVVR